MKENLQKTLGSLVISLDFELLWGVFDKVDFQNKFEYFNNTREMVPEILSLFEQMDIHCTWATVGMLFNKNWDDWEANIPPTIPEYKNKNLSAYDFGAMIKSKKTENLCFAPELIKQIKNTPNQEIGTHTYSHYYCLEEGQSLENFKADIEKSIELARRYNISIKSLVFPRNQFNSKYLGVCSELSIENVRSNPDIWYWKNVQKDNLLIKIFRTGDAYYGLKNKSYKNNAYKVSRVTCQKASRLFRPHSNNGVLESLKLNRIKNEMTKAAKSGEIYHLWWHPHNFGNSPYKNMQALREVLDHFHFCKRKFGFKSINMAEF